jgi:glycosyltransferase involved in cell wall biosynthesis
MDNKPEVSIILPTYNRAKLIENSLKSILNQTCQDFEVIVVDDGSTDNTDIIINKLRENDERIKYIKHKFNKGGSAARNTGIRNALGKYIAFQDSDDEWLPEKLELQLGAIKNAGKKVGIIYSGMLRINNKDTEFVPPARVVKKEGNIYNELLKGSFIGTPTILGRVDCFNDVDGFDESLSRLQDWDIVLRLSKKYEFKYIDKALIISYFTSDSIGTNQKAFIEAMTIIINKHYSEFNKHKNILSKHYFNMGKILFMESNVLNSRTYFVKAWRANPLGFKIILTYFLTFLGYITFERVNLVVRKINSVFIKKLN